MTSLVKSSRILNAAWSSRTGVAALIARRQSFSAWPRLLQQTESWLNTEAYSPALQSIISCCHGYTLLLP